MPEPGLMNLPMFTCEQCGDEYEPVDPWDGPEGFCSPECAEDYAFGVTPRA